MGIQIIWLLLSSGFLIAVGKGFYDQGSLMLAALFVIMIPIARVLLRFRARGGYRLIRNASSRPGSGSGVVRRHEQPLLFTVLVVIEVAIVLVFIVSVLTYRSGSV